MLTHNTPLDLGRVVVTRTCLARLRLDDEPDLLVMARDLDPLLRRHRAGDWGEIDPRDVGLNEQALEDGSRLLSVYAVRGQRIWIITDAATDVCPACWAGIGRCEPDKGEWQDGIHFRTDLPPRRLSTTVMLPEDY